MAGRGGGACSVLAGWGVGGMSWHRVLAVQATRVALPARRRRSSLWRCLCALHSPDVACGQTFTCCLLCVWVGVRRYVGSIASHCLRLLRAAGSVSCATRCARCHGLMPSTCCSLSFCFVTPSSPLCMRAMLDLCVRSVLLYWRHAQRSLRLGEHLPERLQRVCTGSNAHQHVHMVHGRKIALHARR